MKAIAVDSDRQFVPVTLETPNPGPRDLLVRVDAVAVNPIDTKRRGLLRPGQPPQVLGWDAAGVVQAVGEAVSLFRPGDAVYYAGDVMRPGCNAAMQLVDERLVGRKPATLDFEQAAALPLTTLTAWESLFDRLGIAADGGHRGRSLLIIGAAGGVGSIAIQLAKRVAGLRVIATASRPESREWCLELGADLCVGHGDGLVANLKAAGVANVDYILNCSNVDAYWGAMAEAVRPQGAVCCLASAEGPLDINLFKTKSAAFVWEFMFTRAMYQTDDMAQQGAILNRVAALVECGAIRSTLRECLGALTPASLAQAHARLESGRTLGKLVLKGLV
ncbi:zinc-binding alcohol dehydrogenase family protein [Methylogaea oryzae]|uniref:Zinc-type alcohol dehydrogenase-like protein n=1 Tax=Methylogaea oryzae TaxID=1295382 RepID=A0A8D5AI54_9GAMM|nr:zinc-binding alcohol dehydrogenase family protein [Methylogaea oryzae]BBL72163.1 NADPH:quinone reductase [Methylogaea oryzae]